jgi:2-polyprenyl-3-methyl-5-hydroxy-6-metoxy-1,4-benzoquinol methylase
MEFTGERPTLDHEVESSMLRYKAVAPFCVGKRVVDYGCGVGRGASYLSSFAKAVVGYDPDPEAITLAKSNFCGAQYTTEFPKFVDFDIVTSVECIEHLEKDDLRHKIELFSNTVPEIIVTTPDGDLMPYRPMRMEDRRGYHTWHYTQSELFDIFDAHYKVVVVMGCAFDPTLGRYTGHMVYARNDVNLAEAKV